MVQGGRNQLGAGEKAVPPLLGEGIAFRQHHLCGAKGCLSRSDLEGAEGHLGGAVALIGQYHWMPRGTYGQYCPESKGSWQGAPGWAPRLVKTQSLGQVRRLVRNIPPGEGRSGSAGPSGWRTRGVWRLDLLLGDLGRYHSLLGEGGR